MWKQHSKAEVLSLLQYTGSESCMSEQRQPLACSIQPTPYIQVYKPPYKCPCPLCPCSRCGQRGHKMRQTSSKQSRRTLSMAFTSNLQDFARYSTMDNWPSWAAQCKAVYPASSETNTQVVLRNWEQDTEQQQDRWEDTQQKCIESFLHWTINRKRLTTDHHLCTHACRMKKELGISPSASSQLISTSSGRYFWESTTVPGTV